MRRLHLHTGSFTFLPLNSSLFPIWWGNASQTELLSCFLYSRVMARTSSVVVVVVVLALAKRIHRTRRRCDWWCASAYRLRLRPRLPARWSPPGGGTRWANDLPPASLLQLAVVMVIVGIAWYGITLSLAAFIACCGWGCWPATGAAGAIANRRG